MIIAFFRIQSITTTNPDATITSVKLNGTVISPVGSTYDFSSLNGSNTVIIVVTAADGTTTQTYTMNFLYNAG